MTTIVRKINSAFTLAEMMVVMLIVSLVTVAMLPVMTVRQKDKSGGASENIWQYSVNKSDIYYGLKDSQGAIIGANALAVNEKSRLVLNTPTSWSMAQSHLVFKNNNAVTARFSSDANGNLALGQAALISNTSGQMNTANGTNALYSNTTGERNTANGYNALYYNTTGFRNTATGISALGVNTIGYSNTANGADVLLKNTSGYANTANGYNAMNSNISGYSNTANGTYALYSNTTGKYNTGIGYNADVGSGELTYATAIGAFAIASNSSSVVIGRSIDSVYAGSAGLLMASDKKLKNITGLNNSGLDELRKINVYNYTLKADKQKKNHVGVIAQDVQKVFPQAVGVNTGTLYVNYNDLNMAMINAIKQLDKLVQELKSKVTAIVNIQSAQDKKIRELEAQNKSLEIRLLKLEKKLKK